MALSDELGKLQELHQRGGLTDAEFARAKARLLDADASPVPAHGPAPAPLLAALNALRRSRADRWIAGVCGGIAAATGVESWVWRLLFAMLAFLGGTGLVIYGLLWLFVPED